MAENMVEKHMVKFTNMISRVNLTLNPHQYDGVKWCLNNEMQETLGILGGFIIDEMGLGKTIMMIGTIVSHYVGATLIVLPPILMVQWQKEIKRTTGHEALIYHGQNKKEITIEQLQQAPIVLATYSAISKESKESTKENLLHLVKWARVVFDEAHHLRNKTQALTGCLCLQSRIRWLITGTPIQNKISDFYNLCNAVGIPSEVCREPENKVTIINNLVLRRTKLQVGINIPSIETITHLVEWENAEEKELAEEIHATLKFSNIIESKVKELGNGLKTNGMLQLVLRAKQSCILPKLLNTKLELMVEKHEIDPEYLIKTKNSSKINIVVRKLIERKDNGNGKIVFCQYREEIDTIARRLRRVMDNVATFDGRNNASSRTQILSNSSSKNKNSNSSKVLILQIQTGCEGLNLQQDYSEVYFVSPNWNPSVEDQAVARCHRIGQKKQVTVFRFEMDGFSSKENQEEEDQENQEETISIDNYIKNIQIGKRCITQKLLTTVNE